MSSFNFFTPSTPNSGNPSFGPCSSSFNPISSTTCPKPTKKPSSSRRKHKKSTLNPSASSYIPLSATAAPYIPIPQDIQQKLSKPLPPPKKVKYPSFTTYQQLSNHQLYNATKHINDIDDDTLSQFSSSSNFTSSTMQTPIPASVTSSIYDDSDSDIMDIDLDNIKPYDPENHKHDIDLVYNLSNTASNTTILTDCSTPSLQRVSAVQQTSVHVITEDKDAGCDILNDDLLSGDDSSDDERDAVHPAIAALNDEQSAKLLNAPIWSPDDIDADLDSDDEEDEEEYKNLVEYCNGYYGNYGNYDGVAAEETKVDSNVVYSKIAMEEEDYQYIIHPGKKPVKYGYMEARQGGSKVAVDDSVIYPPHIQYMQQYQYGGSYVIQEPGESYDSYIQQLVINTSNTATTSNDGPTETAQSNESIAKTIITTMASESDDISKDVNNDTNSVSSGYSIQSTITSSSESSTIAPAACAAPAQSVIAAPMSPVASVVSTMASQTPSSVAMEEDMGFRRKTSRKHLYETKPSKVAVAIEGSNSNYSHTANYNTTTPKVAAEPIYTNDIGSTSYYYNHNYSGYNYNQTNYYQSSPYGESRIAQPVTPQIQYIYCRT